jgi:glycine/D-amino acid oxidase-like deaminating enzyme
VSGSPSPDALVVGAGIVGAACAWELARAGVRVSVLDAGLPGGGATAAGMGHVVVLDDNEPEFRLAKLSHELWSALAPELPAGAEFTRPGTLWVAADGEELDAAARRAAAYGARGVAAELLDARQLAAAEPELRDGLAGGLLVRDDAVVYPPCVVPWLLDGARRAGAQVDAGRRVAAIEGRAVRCADGGRREAACVVLATGAWAPELVPGLPVRRRKGHLVVTDRYPGFVRHQLVELGYLKSAHGTGSESVAFNVQPRPSGQLLVGSSRQLGVDDDAIDHRLLSRMLRRALAYLPGLARRHALRAWTGFRAATPDGQPLIGPWPGHDGLLLATGHEGLGITTAFGTARLVADMVLGRPSPIPREPYLPARLAGSAP